MDQEDVSGEGETVRKSAATAIAPQRVKETNSAPVPTVTPSTLLQTPTPAGSHTLTHALSLRKHLIWL